MNKGSGCLTVFGAIFFIAGVGIFLWGLSSSYDVWRSQGWSETWATVERVELAESESDDGGSTYSVKGQFRYQYQGQEYYSSQLSFYTSSDNIGDYQQSLYRKVNSAKNSGRQLKAYVNPEVPSEAVLDRTMRWGMLGFHSIFLFVFGGVGLGIMLMSWFGKKKLKREEALKSQFKEEPWKWKKEWQSNRIKANTKIGFWFMLVFAAIWNLISLPGVIGVSMEGRLLDEPIKLLVFLFPLVGVGLIIATVIQFRRNRKYGRSELVLEEMPLAVGAVNKGNILVSDSFETNAEAIIRLTCQRKYKTGSGKNRKTSTSILWQSDNRSYAKLDSAGLTRFDFTFDIPKGKPQSDDSNPNDRIEWIIQIERKQPGVDLKLTFEVPAFVVAHRIEAEPAEEDLFADQVTGGFSNSDVSTGGDWTRLGIEETIGNIGTRYYFPPFRQLSVGLFTLVFGLIFSGIAIGTYIGDLFIIFPIAFGFFGLIILLISFGILFFKSAITIGSGMLYVETGKLFMKKRELSRRDIKSIKPHSTMSSGNKRYYDIKVELNSGDSFYIAKHLLNSSDVDDFIDKIKSELGLGRA